MNWAAAIANFIVAILKGIWGRTGQEEIHVDNPPNNPSGDSDDALLDDLGMHRPDPGAANANGIHNGDSWKAAGNPKPNDGDGTAA